MKDNIKYSFIIMFIKLFTACLLLFATLELPYNFYEFLRWYIFIVSLWFIYLIVSVENNPRQLFYVLLGIAFIFNPIFPFHMTKEGWIPIDYITFLIFIVYLLEDIFALIVKDDELFKSIMKKTNIAYYVLTFAMLIAIF